MRPRIGVGIFVFKDGKVLLGYRNPDLDKGTGELKGQGTWSMPGGKVEYQETLGEAIRRELKEETNLELKKFELGAVQDDITETAHYVTVSFVALEYEGTPQIMEPDEISKWEWFDLDHLPEPLYPATKTFLEKYRLGQLY